MCIQATVRQSKYAAIAYAQVLLSPQLETLSQHCSALCISDDLLRSTAKEMQGNKDAKLSALYLSTEIAMMINQINHAIQMIHAVCADYGIDPGEVLQ